MQNLHAKWRIGFAQSLAKRLAAFEGMKAAVIAGSVARDYADEYSDLEIPIFWESLPQDATRHAIAAALNAEFIHAYDGPACEDQLLINGLQVDLWHITTQHEEEILEAVLQGRQIDLGSLNALDTIRCCIPLHGHEIVRNWKGRAREYPDELAERFIREHLGFFSLGELFVLGRRNNPTAYYAQLSFLQQEMFLVLLALNRSYFPTYKWIYHALASLRVKPEAVERRFRRTYEATMDEAAADMKSLLEETLRLVQGQFPQMDPVPVRRRLDYKRAAHDGPVEL